MTRQEYLDGFIKKHGPELPVIFGGHNYVVPIDYMAKHGIKKTLIDAQALKVGRKVTGTPEAHSDIPDDELVRLMEVIQCAPAAMVGVYKLPDDPLGVTRVSLGGDTREAVYVSYRGTIKQAIRMTEIALGLLKIQAEKGEAPPPPDNEQN